MEFTNDELALIIEAITNYIPNSEVEDDMLDEIQQQFVDKLREQRM